MLDFIRLQLKLKWGLNKNNSKKNAIMTTIAAAIAIIIALGLIWGLSYVLKESIGVNAKTLSVLYLTIIMIGLTVVATGMQVSRLYQSNDLHLTARLPVSPFKVFLSYMILNYIDLFIYSTAVLLPILLVFGWSMHCLTITYFFGMILGIIFMPIIPFGLSIFIAIPIMFVSSFLKKHNILKLILFIIFLAGLFALYYYILKVLAQFFIHRNWETGTLEIWQTLLSGLDKSYNPAYYVGNLIFFQHTWLGLGVVLGSGVVLIGGGILVARFFYNRIRVRALDGINKSDSRLSKIDGYGSTRAIFRHTFSEIFHTKTYSYFYLGVAISTPVMVFFCDRLISMVGQAQVGSGINFGVSILVVSVFMAMISSFAASIISIEGKNFYITKLVPVSYRKQLLIKGFLNMVVSLGALLISAIVLLALQFVSVLEVLVLVVLEILFVIGLVFNGINLNLANPNLKPKANGDAEEINITYMLMIGLAISAIFGMASILLPRVETMTVSWTYLVLISACVIYTLINFIVFWCSVDKKYKKIEA